MQIINEDLFEIELFLYRSVENKKKYKHGAQQKKNLWLVFFINIVTNGPFFLALQHFASHANCCEGK